jgi:hypothetical protein
MQRLDLGDEACHRLHERGLRDRLRPHNRRDGCKKAILIRDARGPGGEILPPVVKLVARGELCKFWSPRIGYWIWCPGDKKGKCWRMAAVLVTVAKSKQTCDSEIWFSIFFTFCFRTKSLLGIFWLDVLMQDPILRLRFTTQLIA